MASPELPIRTARLLLRGFEPTDLDGILAYFSRPDVQRYLDWRVRDSSECRAALAAMCVQRRLTRSGDAITLAVVRRSDDALVGQVSLRWTDATAAQAELKFVISPRHRNQGYAVEAVRAALDLGFDTFHFHRIFARCAADNQQPARLLRRLGMRLEAHYREHAVFQGDWDEELHFAILDREWQRASKVKELSRHLAA